MKEYRWAGPIHALKYGCMPISVPCRQFRILGLAAQILDEYMKKTGQKYSKADEQMYGKLCKAGDEEKAIQIAQQKLEQCIREGKTKPSEMCPCTTVHELVGEIKRKVYEGE